MTKSRPNNIRTNKTPDLPTDEQIAKLNALLRETEDLAHKINFPFKALLYTLFFSIYMKIVKRSTINDIFHLNDDNEDSRVFYALFALVSPIFFCAFYKLWKLCSFIAMSIFPNGIGYERTKHPAYEMQHKLGSQEKLVDLINSLRKRVASQHISKNLWKYINLFLSTILPLRSITKYEANLHFGLSPVGPYVRTRPRNSEQSDTLVSRVLVSQQGLAFLEFVYNLWSNYNITGQLNSFAKKLLKLSLISIKWQLVPKTGGSKTLAILKLQLIKTKTTFRDGENSTCNISSKNYLIELHRILLEEKIPVYMAGNEKLFVGYCKLSEKRCRKIKKELLKRLINVAQYEKNTEENLIKLNRLHELVSLKESTWKSYLEFNDRGELATYYYVNNLHIPTGIFDDYMGALSKIAPAANINQDGNIITINGVLNNINNFEAIEDALREANNKIYSENYQDLVFTNVKPRRRRIVRKSLQTLEKKKQTAVEEQKSPYPEKINFGNSVCFFRSKLSGSESKPDNFAYPIHVPWLPEGRAYASVDPAVFDSVSEFLSEKDILARLERGAVHGSSKSRKTKSGAVGIQNCDEPYQNIRGESYSHSSFKLKFTNGTRIFGHKAGEVDNYIHYRFDGPAFGH